MSAPRVGGQCTETGDFGGAFDGTTVSSDADGGL
jgi:hypothetical protein